VKLGLIPGFGGCVRLLRLVGPAGAKELIYTGRDIGAQEAQRIGLVNAVFSTRAAMMSAAIETVGVIAQRSSIAVATCKDILRSLDGKSTAAQLALENAGFGRVFSTADKREGVAAFLAKRSPWFAGR
jgi:enoyl-CoA hydratase